jgi:plastocyanin
MRPLARIFPLALLLVCTTTAGPVPPAAAATIDVSMTGSSTFSPASVTIAQGDTVRWTNNDTLSHSSKSKQNFWNGPNIGQGGTFSEASSFLNAGSYGYFCEVHGFSMSGKVKVRMKKSGSPGAGWTVRWSSLNENPSSRTFDVQVDRPGSSGFESFRSNTHSRSASFNPSREGTYVFRARTDIVGGQSSGYSPKMSLSIS